jgi:diguanylate cyclase (GGDEF)-like protein
MQYERTTRPFRCFRDGWIMLARVAMALAACVAPALAGAQDFDGAVGKARDLAGRDPKRARAALAEQRRTAMTAGQLAWRLAVDEADCRVLSDSDAIEARNVAEAGLDVARAATMAVDDMPAMLSLLRLKACAAGVAMDVGKTDQASAELAGIIQASEHDPQLAPAHALALLERGLHRSRRNELVSGQEDLLTACKVLESLKLRHDLELCHSHLANHYKRVGDTDEALRLLTRLLDDARRRGATADVGVYLHGLAQVHVERRDWPQAQTAFEEDLALAQAAQDRSGIAYAEHGLGYTLLQRDRAADALTHLQRALVHLQDGSDPVQQMRTSLLEARALTALGKADLAAASLARIERGVRDSADDTLVGDWLRTSARAEAQLGRWREAYQALTAWQAIDAKVQAQRLSRQSAQLRQQFNREKDAAEMQALRQASAQEQQLLRAQRLALGLFVVLLAAAALFTVRKIAQSRRLHRLAMLDELTGLPNRRAILARVEEELRPSRRRGRPLAVLMVDVDYFKQVNDAHGHAVGDEVLRHLGALMAASVRSHDKVGRLGGEEFLVVLPDASIEQLRAVAERIRHATEATPCPTAAGPLRVTVSIGVACAVASSEAPHSLVERADGALYLAKREGRNQVSFPHPAIAAA